MSILREALKWLHPAKCLCCRALLTSEDTLCDDCSAALRTRDPAEFVGDGFAWCVAPFVYGKTTQQLIQNLKFHGLHSISEFFGHAIVSTLHGKECDFVTWVPVSLRRHKERGYSQSHLIAKVVAKELGKPCLKTLTKTRHTEKQSKLKVSERQANVSGAYAVTSDNLAGKRVLLIDDVWTSGSTMIECSSVLREAGAYEVYGAAACKAR